MLDRARALDKLSELQEYVRLLEEVAPAGLEAYRADIHRRLEGERLLHVGIECLLDLAELFARGLRTGLPPSQAASSTASATRESSRKRTWTSSG